MAALLGGGAGEPLRFHAQRPALSLLPHPRNEQVGDGLRLLPSSLTAAAAAMCGGGGGGGGIPERLKHQTQPRRRLHDYTDSVVRLMQRNVPAQTPVIYKSTPIYETLTLPLCQLTLVSPHKDVINKCKK